MTTPPTLKITLLGEPNVGKTSIIGRFVDGVFDKTYSATIGVSFLTKTVQWNNSSYTLNIWDTSGSERHRSVAPNYYRGTDACILVYDVSNRETLEPLSYWHDEFTSLAGSGSQNVNVPIILLGNKADLGVDESLVAEAKQFADVHGVAEHFVVSALSGQNVEDAFNMLVGLCASHQKHDFQSVILKRSQGQKEFEKRGKCC
jgi:small GTP-binding protein